MNIKKVTSGKVTGIKLTPTYYHKPSENAQGTLIAILLMPILFRFLWFMVTGL